VPVDLEPVGERVDGGVVFGERVGRPVHRPASQSASRLGELVAFGERVRRTERFAASPDSLAPPDANRPAPERGVVQHLHPPSMRRRMHSAARAARQSLVSRDEQPQLHLVALRRQDTHPRHAEHHRRRRAALTTVHSAEAFTFCLLGRCRFLRASAS
jgi:hypothetical protein